MAITIRNQKQQSGEKVMIPGDPEKENEQFRFKKGIPIKKLDLEKLNELAKTLDIKGL